MESVSDIDVRQTRLDIADGLNIASSTLEAVGFYEGWVCFVGVMLVPRLPMTTRPQRAFFIFFFIEFGSNGSSLRMKGNKYASFVLVIDWRAYGKQARNVDIDILELSE
jgi:hypothetical protein